MECKAWKVDGEGLNSPIQISVQILHQTKVHMMMMMMICTVRFRGYEDGGDDLKSKLPHLSEELTRPFHAG